MSNDRINYFSKFKDRWPFPPKSVYASKLYGRTEVDEQSGFHVPSFKKVINNLVDGLIGDHGAVFIPFESYVEVYDDPNSKFFNPTATKLFEFLKNPLLSIYEVLDTSPGCDFFQKFFLQRVMNSSLEHELLEFIYVTVDRKQSLNKKSWSGSGYIVLKGFFVIRSLVGQAERDQYLNSFDGFGCRRLSGFHNPYGYLGRCETAEEAKSYWNELMLPVYANSSRGYELTANLHAWHWFRTEDVYNSSKWDADKSLTKYAYEQFLSFSAYGDYFFNPFAYFSSLLYSLSAGYLNPNLSKEDRQSFEYPKELRHPHHDIPGINAPDSYSTPTVLLHLLHIYTILFKITFIEGLWYANRGHYLEHLGSAEWFRVNIYSIMIDLGKEFPATISAVDVEFMLIKQLNNVIEAIFLDPNAILKWQYAMLESHEALQRDI